MDPLGFLRFFLAQNSNSYQYDHIGKFVRNRHLILQTMQELLTNFKQVQNYAEVFINQDGVYLLFHLLEIARNASQHDCKSISEETNLEEIDFIEIKRIEHSLLLCVKYLVQHNQAVVLENDYQLRTLFASLSSSETSSQVILLKILAKICNLNVDKVLNAFTWHSVVWKQNARFKCLVHLLNSRSTECVVNTLNLVNRIMTNVSLAKRIHIQYELEITGFTVQMIKLDRNDKIQEKIEEFNSFCVDMPPTLNLESITSETSQLHKQVQQLNQAFYKLESEKRNLLFVENQLKQKCDILMKDFSNLKIHNFAFAKVHNQKSKDCTENQIEALQREFAIKSCKATIYDNVTNDISLDDLNMKSSEEEMVCASVILSKDNFSYRNCESTREFSTDNSRPNGNPKNGLPYLDESFISNRTKVNMYSNNLQRSKYFCYIKDNADTIGNGHHSFRKSISRMFKLNRKTTKSHDSICSANGSIAGPEITQSQKEYCMHDWKRNSTCSLSGNDSVKSFSLPNAFRSNFILRKNTDMYFSKSHLCSEAALDSISLDGQC